ncbi:hypothetical protein [Qipengyuania spongiae]|uniref:Uncharacterized protein n=1 Tax=Qipengyuania spongiae TaxID=2909673 RepID=A0ABY5SUW8_9SPHN|nr:hypothetical protein [Qipengyuania spongiae]UVI38342.1 hypothetical protein L1F33_08705 [Qipengyuania spongiae]
MPTMMLRNWLLRTGLLAILLAVLCQAMPSAPIPIVRDRGSAFDATTVEVAVLAQRDEAERQVALPKPAPPLAAVEPMRPVFVPAAATQHDDPPRQTGPPLRRVFLNLPPSRGPPFLA